MASVHVGTETETPRGWAFEVRVVDDAGTGRDHVVELGWADYDLWCGGTEPPADVVAALLAFWLEREPAAALRDRFDAALIRRRHPEVDEALRGPERRSRD